MGRWRASIEGRVVTFRIVGPAYPDELLALIEENTEQLRTRDVLWDFREADLRPIAGADWREMVRAIEPFGVGRAGRRVALLARPGVQFGLARMAEMTAASRDYPAAIMTFEKHEDALAWLKSRARY